jgi:hypothetical protein
MNIKVSKASFSACWDGIRKMPCRTGLLVGVVGWLDMLWERRFVIKFGGAREDIERRPGRAGEIGAAGAREGPFDDILVGAE